MWSCSVAGIPEVPTILLVTAPILSVSGLAFLSVSESWDLVSLIKSSERVRIYLWFQPMACIGKGRIDFPDDFVFADYILLRWQVRGVVCLHSELASAVRSAQHSMYIIRDAPILSPGYQGWHMTLPWRRRQMLLHAEWWVSGWRQASEKNEIEWNNIRAHFHGFLDLKYFRSLLLHQLLQQVSSLQRCGKHECVTLLDRWGLSRCVNQEQISCRRAWLTTEKLSRSRVDSFEKALTCLSCLMRLARDASEKSNDVAKGTVGPGCCDTAVCRSLLSSVSTSNGGSDNLKVCVIVDGDGREHAIWSRNESRKSSLSCESVGSTTVWVWDEEDMMLVGESVLSSWARFKDKSSGVRKTKLNATWLCWFWSVVAVPRH